MPCVTVVAPILTASWPVLSSAILSAAVNLGYSTIKDIQEKQEQVEKESVEIAVDNCEVLKEAMDKRQQEKLVNKEDVGIAFYNDIRGKFCMRINGIDKTKEQLKEIGMEMLNKINQQYVYNKIISELKHKGYSVVSEEMTKNKSVQVVVRRFA